MRKREGGFCAKGHPATSIVAAYSRSFRLRRFASPLEKQSRLWRPVNSNQRFEYDRLVRGRNSRHWRESAHLPPALSPKTILKRISHFKESLLPEGFPIALWTPSAVALQVSLWVMLNKSILHNKPSSSEGRARRGTGGEGLRPV